MYFVSFCHISSYEIRSVYICTSYSENSQVSVVQILLSPQYNFDVFAPSLGAGLHRSTSAAPMTATWHGPAEEHVRFAFRADWFSRQKSLLEFSFEPRMIQFVKQEVLSTECLSTCRIRTAWTEQMLSTAVATSATLPLNCITDQYSMLVACVDWCL